MSATSDLNYCDSVLPIHLLQNFNDMLNTGDLCDVILLAEGDEREIAAHRLVLSAASPCFRRMFTGSFREKEQQKITLSCMEYDILKDVIQFFYTSNIIINEDNIYSLMDAASFLQSSGIRRACYHYLSTTLAVSNCLSVYANAKKHCYADLADSTFRYILNNFDYVIDVEEFSEAPLEILTAVFSSQYVNVPNEGRLLEALIKWVKYSKLTRGKHINSLLKLLNIRLIPVEILECIFVSFENDPVISKSELHSRISEVISEMTDKKEDGNNSTKKSRKYFIRERHSLEGEVMMCFGGDANGVVMGSVECFTSRYDRWKCVIPTAIGKSNPEKHCRVIPSMMHARIYMGIASRHYEMFVIGGRNRIESLDSVEYYSVQSNVWSSLAPLPEKVHGCSATFCEGVLYVLGGVTSSGPTKKVWAYEEDSNCWHEESSMMFNRAYHGAVSLDGVLYVMGGIESWNARDYENEDDSVHLNAMERFDPYRNAWQPLAPMMGARCKFGYSAHNGYIYVMGGYANRVWFSDVQRYDIITNQWTSMASMLKPRSDFMATLYHNHIYCAGGHNGVNSDNTVEKYNPNTNRWHSVVGLQVRRFGPGLTTLHIPAVYPTAI